MLIPLFNYKNFLFRGQFIIETSYALCEDLIDGRLSFQGENPEIERIMELEEQEKNKNSEPKNEVDVTDVEMASIYQARTKINVRNIAMRSDNYNPQDEPKKKKPKFLKHADD